MCVVTCFIIFLYSKDEKRSKLYVYYTLVVNNEQMVNKVKNQIKICTIYCNIRQILMSAYVVKELIEGKHTQICNYCLC